MHQCKKMNRGSFSGRGLNSDQSPAYSGWSSAICRSPRCFTSPAPLFIEPAQIFDELWGIVTLIVEESLASAGTAPGADVGKEVVSVGVW